MSEIGKAEVQKMYDAQNGITKEKNDPFAALNPETGNFFFRNEYERKMFLVGLESSKVDAAISTLTKIKEGNIPSGDSKNTLGLSPSEAADYLEVLGKLKYKLQENKQKFRAELHDNVLVLDATIPGPKWEKSDKTVTIEGKKYGVEKREWSKVGLSDLKIDAGLATSVLVKDVPDDTDTIDAVLKAYEAANQKDVKDNSPLKSGWFGRTVKYEEIKSLVESKPVAAPAQVVETSNQTIDLNKEGWTLNKDNKLEKDGKLFSGKGKLVKEGKDGYTAEWTYKDGVLIDGTMKYQDRVRSGKFDPNTGKLIDGYRQFNDNKWRVEWKFDKDTGYLLDGTYITKEGAVYKGTWNNKGENFSGTITALDGKVTKWENGKEVIAEKSIADILREVKAPKWYTLSYDEGKKQVQLKKGDKVVGYFTPGNKENADKADGVGIQKWVDTKVQKIRDAAVKIEDPDKSSSASDILESIQKIQGLEWVKTLKELGFTKDKDWIAPPAWLSWEDNVDSGNWNVKLKDGYTVYNGKVVKIWGR